MTSPRVSPVRSQPVPPATSSMGRIARGGAVNLLGSAVSAIANLALVVVLTRTLPQGDVGVFFSATSLFLLATTLGQFGTGTGLVYFLSRCRALDQAPSIRTYVQVALRPVVAVACAMSILLFALAPQIAQLASPDHSDQSELFLRGLAWFIPLAGLENALLAATRGMGVMRPNAMVELMGRPLLQLLLVGTVVWVGSASGLAWAWGASYVPAALAAWWWWRRVSAKTRSLPAPRPSEVRREFWRFSAPRALTNVVQVAMQRFDIVLVGALAGAPAAAVYAASTRFVVVGQMGNNAISMAAQPRLAESLSRQDRTATTQIYRTSTAWLIVLVWPIYLVFAVHSGLLLQVFGGGYSDGATALSLLCVAMLVGTGFGMVDMMLSMAGHTSWNLANAVLALVVQLGVDFWLIPDHGVLGAAIGWGASILVRNVAALVQVHLALGFHPFSAITATAGATAVACFAVLPFATRLAFGDGTAVLLASLAGAAVVYGIALFVFRGRLQLGELGSLRRGRRKPNP